MKWVTMCMRCNKGAGRTQGVLPCYHFIPPGLTPWLQRSGLREGDNQVTKGVHREYGFTVRLYTYLFRVGRGGRGIYLSGDVT